MAVAVAAAPLPGAAQAVVRSARLSADVPPGASDVEVRVEYTVSRPGAASRPLRLEVLGFGPASVDGVRVEAAGGEAISLVAETGSMRAGTFSPPAAPGASEAAFTLVYRVRRAVERSGPDVRVRVPVLVVDLPPEPGGGPVFHGSVRLPDGWSVSAGFPTALARTAGGAWEVDLAVVPALVSLRGRSDGAWRPGLPEVLDGVALLVLLGFGLVGWRHLREVATPEARP